jgi:potassium-transporting ATPase KdpC subunit
MFRPLRVATLMLLVLSVVTGVVYPLVITGVAQLVFPARANGSLILRDGKLLGSELIGQPFDDPQYFWSRPSATGPFPYNATASSGSNWAVGNPAQLEALAQRVQKLRASDPGNPAPIPADLVTASASGLDPHISPAAARWQIARVARARGVDPDRVARLVAAATQPRQWQVLGEPRVNVLKLNLSLDSPVADTEGAGL